MCGTRRPPAASGAHVAAQQPEPLAPLELDRALEQQLHAEADAEQRHARLGALADHLVEAERAQVLHRARERADAGHDDAVGARGSRRGRASARRRAPTCANAFSTERRLPMP